MSKSHLPFFGLIGALVVWFFAGAMSGAYSFAVRDAAYYYHPLFEYIRSQWGAGRLPLWNPHGNIGVPLVAENTSSVFYPGKLIFALPLDYTLLYNVYIVSHVVLASATSYRLARHWRASVPAATLAAMSYAFCGNVLSQYCNVIFLVSAAWLPWAAELADRMLRRRSHGATVGLGVVLAMMITGGDPEMAYNTVLVVALYGLLLWRAEKRAARSDERPAPKQHWAAHRTALLTGACAVCAMLAAVQILPTLEASRLSLRAAYSSPRNIYEVAETWMGRGLGDERFAWYAGLLGSVQRGHQGHIYDFGLAPWRVIECLWPNISGLPFPTYRRWVRLVGAEQESWTPSLYMGLLPFLLALLTWNVRARAPVEVRWLSWMALLGALGSLGAYGVAWAVGLIFGGSDLVHIGGEVGGLYWWLVVLLPAYAQFRYPAKLFVVASLGLSILAARGWDDAWSRRSVALRRACVAVIVASLVGLCAAAVGWGAVERKVPASDPEHLLGPFDSRAAWWDVTGALLQTAVLAIVFLSCISWAGAVPRRAGRARAAALLVTALDLALAQGWLVRYAPSECWRSRPDILNALPADFADYRVFRRLGAQFAPSWVQASSQQRLTDWIRWERDTLTPKYSLPWGVSLIDEPGNLLPNEYVVFLYVAWAHTPRRRQSPLPHASVLDLLATRAAIVGDAIDSPTVSRLAIPAEGMFAYLRLEALPRAWIVHEVQVLEKLKSAAVRPLRERTEAVLFPNAQGRDWRRVAVVETDEPFSLAETAAGDQGDEKCRLVRAEPLTVEIEARLNRPGLVVLSDLYYPGWELTAETDGKTRNVPILRTNRVMRGTALGAGEHRLVYRYRPKSVWLGAAISALTATGLVIGAVVARLRRARPSPPATGRPGAQI